MTDLQKMPSSSPERLVLDDEWSSLSGIRAVPEIDFERLHAHRIGRIRDQLRRAGAALGIFVNPISLRYAADYRSYLLFQSHIPSTYLFVPTDGPTVLFNGYQIEQKTDDQRTGPPISVFDGGDDLGDYARLFADTVADFLNEIGSDNRRVAVEYVNPSVTQALLQTGLEVADGTVISEMARVIKSPDEIACMQWAVDVACHGIAKMREALRPGVSEVQLWALLNYANLANDGDWHEGRMLASGPRINPWLQEASTRRVESGDLVGFDTDMVGPFGYFADISRTFHCGPAKPTKRQKLLYRLALDEVEHNLALVRPGVSFSDFQANAYPVPEIYHAHAYPVILHGVGMCDEYPKIIPGFIGPNPYDGVIEAGMVLCIESFMGAVGEPDGVKLEQQVLVTETGYELLSHAPLESALLD